jgi:class 3 adenylate cyclase
VGDETSLYSGNSDQTVECTVLFSDVVDFSLQSASDQTAIKEHFNGVVGESIVGVAASDRIVLDTGDGVALCLFGDPEVGILVALGLRDGFAGERPFNVPDYAVRIGVNHGPINVVTDLNHQVNAIGHGINVAQRVMSFAEPGQVLCSRAFYAAVTRLSDENTQLFEYRGVRHDKHVLAYDVYEVVTLGSSDTSVLRQGAAFGAASANSGCSLDPDTFERLVTLLSRYEGPMGRVLVKRACASESDASAVINKISLGMSDTQAAEEFVRLTKALIGPG